MPATPEPTPARYELTILIPCRNEEGSIAHCVGEAREFLQRNGIDGEVVVIDNGSRDRSAELAQGAGARVVAESRPGYGNAVNAGIDAADGRFIILGDADGEHDLGSLGTCYERLRDGYDFVFGNRFATGGAASSRLRNAGTAILFVVGKVLFRAPVRDFNCGLRGFKASSVRSLALRCPGMEATSEMVVKAVQAGMRITEVVVTQRHALDPDRASHLRVWRDGWRHLRLLLMLSPRWLYFYPGCLLFAAGAVAILGPILYPVEAGGEYGSYTMLFGAAFVVYGMQLIIFSLLANAFCENIGLSDKLWARLSKKGDLILEGGVVTGFILALVGAAGSIWSLLIWAQTEEPNIERRMRVAIPSVTLLICGVELIVSAFFYGLLTTQGTMRRSSER